MKPHEQVMLRYLWELAPIVALLVDAEGFVCDANAHARTLFGPEVVGRPFQALVVLGPEQAGDDAAVLAHLPDRVHLILSGDQVDTYRVTSFPVDQRHLVLAIADDEDRAFSVAEVAKLNDEVQNLARELARKNAELARLNELKNRFLGMAAHDLRKPIGSLLAYSEIMADEVAPGLAPQHRRFLDIIRSACGFMSQLIDDFLDVAIIESGHLEIRRVPIDPASIIRESLELANVHAERRGVSIVEELTDGPSVRVDPMKMEQVVNNLVLNAVDHSPVGEAVVVRSTVADGFWTIVVADEGPGIAPEEVERLFDAFQRGTRSQPKGRKSTGLGLAISRKIVEGHGGKITVESELGAGATFTVSIPVEGQERS